jgi:hypothetical protein
LDLSARLAEDLGEAIVQFELPALCELRPHEDPYVEDWLRRWADFEDDGPITLELRSLVGLRQLAAERPEVCPLLRTAVSRFEEAASAWFTEWPRVEPWRKDRDAVVAPSSTDVELELHAVLSVARGLAGTTLQQGASHFCQVAMGWIHKLDSVYGLSIPEQPTRIARLVDEEMSSLLSLLSWDTVQLVELLRCPFFRSDEHKLWSFAQAWCLVQGAPALEDELTQSILWELLPATESVGDPGGGGVDSTAPDAMSYDCPDRSEETSAAYVDDMIQDVGSLEDQMPGNAGADGCANGVAECVEVDAESGRPTSEAYHEALIDGSDPSASGGRRKDGGEEESSNVVAPYLVERESEGSSRNVLAAVSAPEITPGRAVAIADDSAPSNRVITVVNGQSFCRVARSRQCSTAAYDESGSFAMGGRWFCNQQKVQAAQTAQASSLVCRNFAVEEQIIGASRQMIVSRTPMHQCEEGKYQLHLRLLSGADAEAAHLFEVGLVANPFEPVHFTAATLGAGRPLENGEGARPFFSLIDVPTTLIEGVRLVVEADFAQARVSLSNLPALDFAQAPSPVRLDNWLEQRGIYFAVRQGLTGELDCPLFREHATHLKDLIDEGRLDGPLADAVLSDAGVQCVLGAHSRGNATMSRDATQDLISPGAAPKEKEEYHFYVVVPAGVEVEIF